MYGNYNICVKLKVVQSNKLKDTQPLVLAHMSADQLYVADHG